MPNRPSRPLKGSSYESAGHGAGQIIRSLFDTGGPALNPEFGQDPMTAEGRPISKYGADEIYQQPTLAQRFFNPTAVAQAQREQAAYRVQQIVSKQEAERQLENALRLQQGSHTNAVTLAQLNNKFRADADAEAARLSREYEDRNRADAKWTMAEREIEAEKKAAAERERIELAAQRENALQGTASRIAMGDGVLSKAIYGEGDTYPGSPQQNDMMRRAAVLFGGKAAQEQGYGQAYSQQAAFNANNARIATPVWQAAAQGKADADAYLPVSSGQTMFPMTKNLPLITGQSASEVLTPNPLGADLPPIVTNVTSPATVGLSANEKAESERILKQRAAEKKAAGSSAYSGVTQAADVNPYAVELERRTNDSNIENTRAQVSDLMSQLRATNARIKAGGFNIPAEFGDASEFVPDTTQYINTLLTKAAQIEEQRKKLLLGIQGRKPLSK